MTWFLAFLGTEDDGTEPLCDWRHADKNDRSMPEVCRAEYDGAVCTIKAEVPHTIHEAAGTGGTVVAVFWRAADR